jgi:hypothetical protein
LANFQRIVEVFTQKIFNMLSNIWVWNPGSEIRKKPIPDPGSRGQKGTGSRIPDPGSGSATLGLSLSLFRYLPVFGCFCFRLSACCVYHYIYMNNLYIVMYFRTLIESKPVGFSHISMQAKVSASGLIKEVMDDEFTFIYSDADPG